MLNKPVSRGRPGSNSISRRSSSYTSAPSGSIVMAPFTPEEVSYFDQLFYLADSDRDGVIGSVFFFVGLFMLTCFRIEDAAFFKKSGLSLPVLGQIWQLADGNGVPEQR